MANPRTQLNRTDLPTKTPHRFGLKSVARSEQKANGHWMFGSDWQESCGTNLLVAPDNCDPALTEEQRTKDSFSLADGVGTDEFTLYGMHRCSAIGMALSERSGLAMDELNLGEWFQIEKVLADKIRAEGTAPLTGTQNDAKKALAGLLQTWDLPVEPVVHMTPNVAVALEGQFKREAMHLELTFGGLVSVGHGYADAVEPDGDPVLANYGSGLIALTGPVFVEYGSAIENEQMDVATNTYLALAERPYTVGYLCKATYAVVTGLAVTA